MPLHILLPLGSDESGLFILHLCPLLTKDLQNLWSALEWAQGSVRWEAWVLAEGHQHAVGR